MVHRTYTNEETQMNHDRLYQSIEEALEQEYTEMFNRPGEELESFLDELDTQSKVEQEEHRPVEDMEV